MKRSLAAQAHSASHPLTSAAIYSLKSATGKIHTHDASR